MPRLDHLPEVLRNTLLTLPVQVNQDAPFSPLTKPLADCRVAVVTTAGLHLRDDRPFAGGDTSYRAIPSTSRQDEILQSHASIGFDRTATQRDLNIVFPLERMRELVARRELGSLSHTWYSFMGAQRDATPIETGSAPEVAARLKAEGTDVVFLTPT